jgi:hypothetical protein
VESEALMAYNWCHGPKCHTNRTQDRIRGVKGNKVLRTRKITENNWNKDSVWSVFCSQGCYTDFFYKYWQQVIAIAPRTEPLETPIEVKQKEREGYEYVLGNNGYHERRSRTYYTKEIVDRPTEN